MLPAFGCCILLLLVLKTVLTLCNLRWWCFSCHQLLQRPHWCLQWALSATCTGGVFLVPTSALSKVHTWLAFILLLPTATCTGGVFPLPTRHLLMYTRTNEHLFCNLHCVVVVVYNYINMYVLWLTPAVLPLCLHNRNNPRAVARITSELYNIYMCIYTRIMGNWNKITNGNNYNLIYM